MSDQLELGKFRIKMMANDHLMRAVVLRLRLLDPGFVQDARQLLDTLFGHLSVSEYALPSDTPVLSAIREEYLKLLAQAEKLAQIARATPKHKSIRRRIFEGFERG